MTPTRQDLLQALGQIHNEKGRVGKFKVFHVGKMAYTVEADGHVLGNFRNLSQAYSFASARHYASKAEEGIVRVKVVEQARGTA